MGWTQEDKNKVGCECESWMKYVGRFQALRGFFFRTGQPIEWENMFEGAASTCKYMR